MADIAAAQQLALRGERAEARQAFTRLWDRIGPDGSPLHRAAADLDKLGRHDEARGHLTKARAAESDLPAEGHGELIRSEIAALHGRLVD